MRAPPPPGGALGQNDRPQTIRNEPSHHTPGTASRVQSRPPGAPHPAALARGPCPVTSPALSARVSPDNSFLSLEESPLSGREGLSGNTATACNWPRTNLEPEAEKASVRVCTHVCRWFTLAWNASHEQTSKDVLNNGYIFEYMWRVNTITLTESLVIGTHEF